MKYYTKSQPQSRNRVTQKFGVRPEFYKKFGFKGHEGLDLNDSPGVPTPVYAVESGIIVVRPFDGAYGKRIDIYNETLDIMFSYCHLSEFAVKTKDKVKPGQLIGYTGNTSTYDMPIHLHFMAVEIDKNLDVINTRNGYNGSLKCGIEEGNFYMEVTRINQYKGVPIIQKKQPKNKPLRLGMYNPYTKKITLYERALTKSDKDLYYLLEHEWSHKVYWDEFTVQEVREWELISSGETLPYYGYFTNKYISPGETNASEDFAETWEDIIKNPKAVYDDARGAKKQKCLELMARHGYYIEAL